MKTGPQKPRLSEKLAADMEQMRTENAALIATQLESFRNDLKITAESALATIKTDTEGYLLRVRKHLLRQSANAARPEWTAMIYPVLIACALMISISLSTWTVLNWLTPSMQSLGIRMIERPEATYLIPFRDTTTLTHCRLGTQTVDCLMIEEE